MLTKEDYGAAGNFNSWVSILAIVATLHLESACARAKFDYKDDFDGYISSTVCCGSLVSALFYACILIAPDFFSKLFNIDLTYLHVLCLVLIFSPAFDMFQIKLRYEYRYVISVAISLTMMIVSTLTGVVLVHLCSDKLFGRIMGANIPKILVYITIFCIVLFKGRKFFVKEYWKYAILYSLPIIPHLLSNVILGSSDKIMILKIEGKEAAGIYTLAYSCGMLVSILMNSFNRAMTPWLSEKLYEKDYDLVKKVNRWYIAGFIFLVEGMILVAPELMYFLGGSKYAGAEYLVAPVMLGYGFKFAYTNYVNVEQFEKKTGIVSIGTLIAAGFNFITNLIFIPIFGYQAAAYTTLAGFMMLLLMHYFACKKIGFGHVYDNRFTFEAVTGMLVIGLASQLLFANTFIRWAIIVLVSGIGLVIAYNLFKKFRKKVA